MIQAYRDIFSLPRPVWMLFGAGLINRIGHMVLPFLALYSNQVLGLSVADASLVVVIYGVGALVTGFFAGWLCDRFGAIYVMITSLILSSFLYASLSEVRNPFLFGSLVFLLSLASESFRPSLLTLASRYGTPEKQRQAFALIRLSVNLGMSVGPVMGGVVFTYSPKLLFWCNAVGSFSAGLLMWSSLARGIFLKGSEQKAEERVSLFRSLEIAYSDRRLMWLLVGICPAITVLFQHESALPLILVKDLGMSESAYGSIFTVNTLMIVMLEIWLISVTARYRPGPLIALGAILTGIGFALISWVKTPLHLHLMTAVWTAGEMLLFPIAVTYVSMISTPATRGSYMAAYGTVVSLCLVAAPYLGTQFWQVFGLGGFSVFCLVGGAATALWVWRVR